jgi:hypothetical protein
MNDVMRWSNIFKKIRLYEGTSPRGLMRMGRARSPQVLLFGPTTVFSE